MKKGQKKKDTKKSIEYNFDCNQLATWFLGYSIQFSCYFASCSYDDLKNFFSPDILPKVVQFYNTSVRLCWGEYVM